MASIDWVKLGQRVGVAVVAAAITTLLANVPAAATGFMGLLFVVGHYVLDTLPFNSL